MDGNNHVRLPRLREYVCREILVPFSIPFPFLLLYSFGNNIASAHGTKENSRYDTGSNKSGADKGRVRSRGDIGVL